MFSETDEKTSDKFGHSVLQLGKLAGSTCWNRTQKAEELSCKLLVRDSIVKVVYKEHYQGKATRRQLSCEAFVPL